MREQPIGYWIRRADDLLTSRIDEAQRVSGLTRLAWQILNLLQKEHAATAEHLSATLRPFADPEQVRAVLDDFSRCGLVETAPDGRHRLTTVGVDLHERALASQRAVRHRAMAGISEPDYLTTLAVLRRLVETLEAGASRDTEAPSG